MSPRSRTVCRSGRRGLAAQPHRVASNVVGMKPLLALVLAAAGSALMGQDRPVPATATELPKLRAAFDAASASERAAVIAVVPGREPVILTAGADSAGSELTPTTLVPLLALAKVLAADAIHVHLKGKVDVACGEPLGDRELTVRELLDGVPVLPDFFVLDGGDEVVDAALLRKCGAMAAGAGMEPHASRLGAPEFVLLEPLALGGHDKDWSSMLRGALSPRVSGLDPVGADAIGAADRSALLAPEDLAKLAKAQPAVLRTLLSLQDLGTWMQWRTQQEVPLWGSARMGAMLTSRARPEVQFWTVGANAMRVSVWLSQYPSKKAALLRVVAPESPALMHQLQVAFEDDLHADEAAPGASQQQRLQAARAGAIAARAARAAPAPSTLGGTRWGAAPAEGKEAVRLAFGASLEERLELTVGGDALSFTMTPAGAGLRATPWRRRTDMFWLLVRAEPDAEKPTEIACVLVVGRVSDARSNTFTTTAAVPHYFELLPEKE